MELWVPISLNGHTTQTKAQEARGLDHFGGRCMRRHVTHEMESTNTLHTDTHIPITITFVLYLSIVIYRQNFI